MRMNLTYIALSLLLLTACHKNDDQDLDGYDSIQAESIASLNGPSDQLNQSKTRSIKVRNIGSLSKVFNDSNYLQLKAARHLGIDPIRDLSTSYFMKRPIVKVESNDNYHIDTLRHSIPYLVPEAASLLNEIGTNFIDSLHSRGGDNYTIKITSLLRTEESVGKLRRVNVNSTDSSTHQYGTTFDISYVNFHCLDNNRQINQGDLKNLLAEVLYDLRQQGKCLVKYEYKTGCFHITVLQ